MPLCIQQYEVLKAQLSWVQVKVITGADGVDSWSVKTWKTVLINVKTVIATPQILLDALLHGFVGISSVALLVFDEGEDQLQ